MSAPRATSSQGAGPSVALGFGPALVGQAEDPLPLRLVGGDQSLVFQGLQGGVDRAGARLPDPATSIGELGDDLVAVHRLLGQEGQDRRPDVAPADLGAPAEAGPEAHASAEAGTEALASSPSPSAAPDAGGAGEPVDPSREARGKLGAVRGVVVGMSV